MREGMQGKMQGRVRWIAIVLLVIVVAALWFWQTSQKANAQKEKPSKAMALAMMTPEVETTTVLTQPLATTATSVGTLFSIQSVVLKPEITGIIKSIEFKDGQKVTKGQVLFLLDDATQKAQLQSTQAQESVAAATASRQQALEKENFVSLQAVEQANAALKVAQAAVQQSLVLLEKTRICAPFNATAGLKKVNVGDYVQPGTELLSLQDNSSFFVTFNLPQRFDSKIKIGAHVQLSFEGVPNETFDSVVTAISPLIGMSDRALTLKTTLNNNASTSKLRAGMFAHVSMVLSTDPKALFIPTQALTSLNGTTTVYTITPGKNGEQLATPTSVTTGEVQNGLTQITSALASGQQIVLTGSDRLGAKPQNVKIIKTIDPQTAANEQSNT